MNLWKFAKLTVPLCLLPTVALASDQVSTWNGGTGNWNMASSWTTSPTDGLVPNNGNGGFTFDAIVGGGTATLDIDVVLNGLTITGGSTIDGSSNLTVLQNVDWQNGSLNGTGLATFQGTTTFSGAVFADRTINNVGTFTGAGSLGGSGILNNQSGGMLHFGESMSFDGTGVLNNQAGGNILVSGAQLSVNRTFHNAGLVFVASGGTFTIGAGGTNTNNIDVSAGSTLVFGGDAVFSHQGAITGEGNVTFNMFSGSGEVIIESGSSFTPTGQVQMQTGTATFNRAVTFQNFAMGGFTPELRGTHVPTVANSFAWTDGTITSGLTLQGSSTLTGGTLDGVIDNYGAASTVEFGGIGQGGGVWNNKPGSSFTLVSGGLGGTGTFNNEAGAVLDKTGSFLSSIGMNLNNAGQFNLQEGDLSLHGVTTNTGTINLASGTTLNVLSGIGGNVFTSSGTITGPGSIYFAPHETATIEAGSTFTVTGLVTVRGEVVFNNSVNIPQLLLEGKVVVNDVMTVTGHATLSHDIQGTGTLNLAGTATQLGGLYIQDATVNVQNSMILEPSSSLEVYSNAVFNNHGTTEVRGQSSLVVQGTFDNKAGATLIKRDADLVQVYELSSATGLFSNAGTFRAEAGLTMFGNGLNVVNQSTGLFHAQGGDITFFGTQPVNNLGELRADEGRTIQIDAELMQYENFKLTGGTYRLNGSGNIVINNASSIHELQNAHVILNGADPSQLSGLIDLQKNQGIFELQGGSQFTYNNATSAEQFQNETTGTLRIGAGSTFTVPTPYELSQAGHIEGAGNINAEMFVNNGTFAGAGGALTLNGQITASGNNSRFTSGSVIAESNINLRGTLTVDAGATLHANGGITFYAEDRFYPRLFVNGQVNTNLSILKGEIGGSGTINGNVATLTPVSGLSPGNSFGTLTITNGLSMFGFSFLSMEIGHSSSDLLRITGGNFSIPAGLIFVHITPLEAVNSGDVFTLIDWTGANAFGVDASDFLLGSNSTVDGTFSIEGSQLLFTISAVPEPTTWALMGIGISGSALVYWRKRRQLRAMQEEWI